MAREDDFRWANDAVEVSVIFVVFVLIYAAVTIGAVGTPILKGLKRIPIHRR